MLTIGFLDRRYVYYSGLALISLLPIWLGWQIVANTMADTRSRTDPEGALAWRSDAPAALAALAEEQLVAAKAEEDLANVEVLAKRALQVGPLEPSALRLLALVADLRGDRDRADVLMNLAAERSRRDTVAQVWLFRQEADAGQIAAALAHADAILRGRPDLGALMLPSLLGFAADSGARSALVSALASDPPWRVSFLRALAGEATAPSVAYAVLSGLQTSAHPPTDGELRPFLDRLIDTGQFELAFLTWMHFLPDDRPRAVRYAYNGDFEYPVSGLPFDWVVAGVRGAVTEIVDTGDHELGQAVRVVFANTRVRYRHLSKLLVLPPGGYRLSGLVKADGLVNARGMTWRVSCAEGQRQPLGQSEPVVGTTSWRRFEAEFTVPSLGCRAQWLRLELAARIALEEQVGGEIWYDRLVIERAGAPDTATISD